MMPSQPPPDSLSVLKRFARARPAMEHCDLCGVEIPKEHRHLVEPSERRLLCGCDACTLLFSNQEGGRYRRVDPRIEFLPDFQLSNAQWGELRLPIDLAFFLRSTPAGRVVAVYPSPAGATESLLDLGAWDDLIAANPVLRELEPDVEALLVNRIGEAREAYRISIDECYKLVGLIRSRWRGLSGGTEVWEAIGQTFADLRLRSSITGASAHARSELPRG